MPSYGVPPDRVFARGRHPSLKRVEKVFYHKDVTLPHSVITYLHRNVVNISGFLAWLVEEFAKEYPNGPHKRLEDFDDYELGRLTNRDFRRRERELRRVTCTEEDE